MIHGVIITPLTTHADDRGFFREILRTDAGVMKTIKQTSVTMTYPGVIKAFHFHKKQDDVWCVVAGMIRAVLFDRRPDSPTKGTTQEVVMGEHRPVALFIPRGVAHGYQVLGNAPITLVYQTSECYNPKNPDEGRIAWDDPTINFDWSVKNR
jgi:dTDP-4-dehydrorhamnose 3,5-epimerase